MGQNNDTPEAGHRIQAVENVFEIIEEIGARNDCGVTELANQLEIPKSTAHVYLKTLQEIGYVTSRDSKYQLSLRFLGLGGKIRHGKSVCHPARAQVDSTLHY